MKMKKNNHIVIIGGGFAGINTALSLLNSGKNIQVTLVDRNNYNFFPPLLYQVATGFLDPSHISYPYRKLFRGYHNFTFYIGELEEINKSENRVILNTGILEYDHLILAYGTTSNFFGNENIKQKSLPMKTVADALLLKNSILERFEKATKSKDFSEIRRLTTIVIAGGGPTGVEIAGMLAELRKNVLGKDYPELQGFPFDIYIVDGLSTVLSPMSYKSQKYTLKALQSLGIKIELNEIVKDFTGETVILGSGRSIPTYNLIWTAGVTVLAIDGLEKELYGRGGRIGVGKFNQVLTTTNIYAIGDSSIQTTDPAFPNGHPQLAQVAIQQGKLLAKNIISLIDNKPLKPFRYDDKGSMAIIGRNKAVADLVTPKIHFKGFIAFTMWLFVHLFSLVHFRNKARIFGTWIMSYFSKDHYLRMIIRPERKQY